MRLIKTKLLDIFQKKKKKTENEITQTKPAIILNCYYKKVTSIVFFRQTYK